jgi:hypothetical protein
MALPVDDHDGYIMYSAGDSITGVEGEGEIVREG